MAILNAGADVSEKGVADPENPTGANINYDGSGDCWDKDANCKTIAVRTRALQGRHGALGPGDDRKSW